MIDLTRQKKKKFSPAKAIVTYPVLLFDSTLKNSNFQGNFILRNQHQTRSGFKQSQINLEINDSAQIRVKLSNFTKSFPKEICKILELNI